jgi:SNF2 family DNA or RNA helicase
MMPTTTLKSWQVTGINALVEFEKDPLLSACVVADSTGLGKTILTIGFWKVVS